MSSVIPPLLSDSPPPIFESLGDDDDDEFGDFRSGIDCSYNNCESLSLPPSPKHISMMGEITEKEDHYDTYMNVKDIFIMENGGKERDNYVPVLQNDVNSLQTPASYVSSTRRDEISSTVDDFECTKHTFEDEYVMPIISTLPTHHIVIQGEELVHGNVRSFEIVDDDTPNIASNYETSEIDRISEDVKVDSYVPCVSTEGSSEIWTFDDNDTQPPSECSGISRGGHGNDLKEEPPDLLETDNEFVDFEDYCRSEFDECSLAVQEADFTATPRASKVERARIWKKNCTEDVEKLQDENEISGFNCKSSDDLKANANESSHSLQTSEFSDCYEGTGSPILGNQSDDVIPPNFCVNDDDMSDAKNVQAVIREKTCTTNVDSSKILPDSTVFLVQNCDEQITKGNSVGESYVSDNLDVSCSFGICTESEKSPNQKRNNINALGKCEDVKDIFKNCNIQDEESFDNFCSFNDKLELSSVENLSTEVTDTGAKPNEEIQLCFVKNRLEVENEDDFGDFDGYSQTAHDSDVVSDEMPDLSKEDEFGDFVTPQHTVENLAIEIDSEVPAEGTDEFADFESHIVSFHPFSSDGSDSIKGLLNGKDILRKVEKVIVDMYPGIDNDIGEFKYKDLIEGNFVYDQVKNIIETNALSYQWAKSSGQDKLLKALNIDTRNILYGPGWTSNMPIFASNLSQSPLEPTKPIEISTLTSRKGSVSSINSQRNQLNSFCSDIPSAQFDWNGAGLVNPLDCTYATTMLLDLEKLVPSLDTTDYPNVIPCLSSDKANEWKYYPLSKESQEVFEIEKNNVHSSHFHGSNIDFDVHLETGLTFNPSNDNESVSSLQLVKDTGQEYEDKHLSESSFQLDDEFDDFTSYTAAQEPDAVCNCMGRNKSSEEDKYLPNREVRKDVIGGCGEPTCLRPTILTPDLPRKAQSFERDDDFTEFQTATTFGVPNLQTNDTCLNESNKTFNSDVPRTHFLTNAPKVNEKTVNVVTDHTKRTDVVGNYDNVMNSLPGNSILQPLKPVKVSAVRVETGPAQINWPNPGITDDDIEHIELTYSYKKNDSSKTNNSKESTVSGSSNQMVNEAVELSVTNSQSVLPTFAKKTCVTSDCTFSVQPRRLPIADENKQFNSMFKREDLFGQSLFSSETASIPVQTKSESQKYILNPDEDDWSDFVGVSVPAESNNVRQCHFRSTNEPERTSTPELSLSVPHLSRLKPPKHPIPVITPHGLIQTKIPSNVFNRGVDYFHSMVASPGIPLQASTISSQYQNHVMHASRSNNLFVNDARSGHNFKYVSGSTEETIGQLNKVPRNDQHLNDDDWTDFVSSPPVQDPIRNGHIGTRTSMQNSVSWYETWPTNNATPNIITNPVHYDSLKTYLPQNEPVHRRTNTVLTHTRKVTIPSISALPDLAFVGPKGHGFTKK